MERIWFVPGDVDLSDLEYGVDEPWQLVHAVTGFVPVPIEVIHETLDGEQHEGMTVEGHPLILGPCANEKALGHGPARVYAGGEGVFFESRREALRQAGRVLKTLVAEKNEVDALERLVHGDEKV